jgi:hypothetical protein
VGQEADRAHRPAPRDAAYILAAFWPVAVIVFGVLERIVNPKTCHSVWLGMWWAVETVPTVGYGEIVPDQTAAASPATAESGAWPVGYANVTH